MALLLPGEAPRPHSRRRLPGGDEGSFARTQYSIFLVTISLGEFIDFLFGSSTDERREIERERDREKRRRQTTGLIPAKKDEEEGTEGDGGGANDEYGKEEWGSVLQLAKEEYVWKDGRRERRGGRRLNEKLLCHLLYYTAAISYRETHRYVCISV